MSDIQGGCRCGAVRYTLALNALPRTYACHCRVKRKQRWLTLPAGVPAWPEGAPPAELMQALRSPGGTSP